MPIGTIMTLTELRYIVTLAQERHFGRAAERCFVSQPTLSVAVKKLEEELEVALFERSKSTVQVTPLGEKIVEQAQRQRRPDRQEAGPQLPPCNEKQKAQRRHDRG